jgi:hypothetical protein
MTPPPTGRGIHYRIVVYELDNDRQTTIMDETATGFIAAAANIHNGEMNVALGDGGPQTLIQHIGLFIAGQYPA